MLKIYFVLIVILITPPTFGAEMKPEVQINGSAAGISYSRRLSSWQQDGNVATFRLDLQLTSKGPGVGNVTVKPNFPLPTAPDGIYTPCPSIYSDQLVGKLSLSCYMPGGSTVMELRKLVEGGTDALRNGDVTNTFSVIMHGTYIVEDGLYGFHDALEYAWYEFAQTADGSILVSYNVANGVAVRRSRNGGKGEWELMAVLPYSAYEVTPDRRIYAPMSKLANGNLAIVVGNGEMTAPTAFGWIEISNNGKTFSALRPIAIPSGAYWFGPLIELNDGTLVVSSHRLFTNNSESWLSSAADRTNWNTHTQIATPADGNIGLTEAVVANSEGGILSVVRSDKVGTGGADGGYVAQGASLANLGALSPIGDIIRMPRLYPINGSLYLAYRRYVPSASGDNQAVAVLAPMASGALGAPVFQHPGANNAPFVYQHQGEWFAIFQTLNKRAFRRVPVAL